MNDFRRMFAIGTGAIPGGYGTVLTAAPIDPALTAITRSAGLGMILTPIVAIARARLEMDAAAAVATLTPFSLWYRGIARCGVARTSICVFADRWSRRCSRSSS